MFLSWFCWCPTSLPLHWQGQFRWTISINVHQENNFCWYLKKGWIVAIIYYCCLSHIKAFLQVLLVEQGQSVWWFSVCVSEIISRTLIGQNRRHLSVPWQMSLEYLYPGKRHPGTRWCTVIQQSINRLLAKCYPNITMEATPSRHRFCIEYTCSWHSHRHVLCLWL